MTDYIDITDMNDNEIKALLDGAARAGADFDIFADSGANAHVEVIRESGRAWLVDGTFYTAGMGIRRGGSTLDTIEAQAWLPKSRVSLIRHGRDTYAAVPRWLMVKIAAD